MSLALVKAAMIMFIVLVGCIAVLLGFGLLIPPVSSVLLVVAFFGLVFSCKEYEEQLTQEVKK